MKQMKLIMILAMLLPIAASAQEERIDTVIPKFLSNGYFFREMPQLPDGEKTMSRLKDKEGNSVIVINVDATLPKSLIRKAIPREQVHNADQFLNGLNMMATVTSLTQAGVKADGTWYSPKEGEPFPQFEPVAERVREIRRRSRHGIGGRHQVKAFAAFDPHMINGQQPRGFRHTLHVAPDPPQLPLLVRGADDLDGNAFADRILGQIDHPVAAPAAQVQDPAAGEDLP